MDLDFSDDQEALREGVRSVLEREWPPAEVRRLVETGDRKGVDDLWRRLVELDWAGLTVPEALGGLGLGAVELAVLAEESGRVVLPGPLLPTLSQFVPAVREAGARWLEPVAAGSVTGTLALAEGSTFDPAKVATTASPDGQGFVVTGEKRFVAEAPHVDELAVVARLPGTTGDEGLVVAVVPTSACALSPLRAFDATRVYATVTLDSVRIDAERVLHPDGGAGPSIRQAVEEATTAVALETVGTCQALLDVTVAYAKERRQFDRPIGSFQAVKHKLADMLVMVERARAAAYFAAACIAEDDERRSEAVSVAKAAAGDAQRIVVQEAIQLHGGIGYTWEHDLHLWVKRAKSGDAVFGTAAEHRARLADALITRMASTDRVAGWSEGR